MAGVTKLISSINKKALLWERLETRNVPKQTNMNIEDDFDERFCKKSRIRTQKEETNKKVLMFS